jgi:hypothetical protein
MTPETIPVDKALWERMCAAIHDAASWSGLSPERAKEISKELSTPVDRLVLRARKICAEADISDEPDPDFWLCGKHDDWAMMRAVLAALREKEAG